MRTARALRLSAYIVIVLLVTAPASVSPLANAEPATPLASSTIQTWTETNDDCVAAVEEHNRTAPEDETVTSRCLTQTVVHGTDQETQSGIFYVNGVSAWIQTHAGYTGSHRCWANRAVGYSVPVTGCDGGSVGNPSTVRMGLQVKPFNAPLSWNEDHYVYLRPDGTYYW